MLQQDLSELLACRLLLVRPGAGEQAYVFRHALVREAAYDSMVRATRQRVHRCIATALRTQLPALGEQQPELLAQHLEAGGELAEASEQWYCAGDRAFRRAANAEAKAHLERALTVLAGLPETPDRTRREVEALTLLGTVYHYTSGHAHPRAREVFARARTLSERHDGEISLKIVTHLSGAYIVEGNRDAMDALAPRCERLATSSDPVACLTGLGPLAIDAFWRGHHRRAAELFDRAVPVYRTDGFRAFAEMYGWDGGVFVPLYAAWNGAVMGEAEARTDALLAAAAASFDPQAPALVRAFAMACSLARRDMAAARAYAEEAIAISTEQRFYGVLALALCGHGLTLVTAGEHADGLAEIQRAIAGLRAAGAKTPLGYYLTYLAGAYLLAGDVSEGLAATAEGLKRCQRELARVHEPELLRLEGRLLLLRGDEQSAASRLRDALDLARERDARAWELRAAVSLGQFLRDRGRLAEMDAVVRPTYERCSENDAFADRREASALLSRS